jgi:CheY-like chemotaxis protein
MKTVLVVEDADDLRESFMAVIGQAGYRVLGAENGQQALDILQSLGEEPCLVLLDWMMPVMDGQTFLSALRKKHRVASLPVVIISANPPDAEGANSSIRKPISASTLTHMVREFCGDT